jgi:DNA-binding transcriptional ArsR family regulator
MLIAPSSRNRRPLTSTSLPTIFTLMGEHNSAQLDAVFGAVADATRRSILAQLATGNARVTDIAAAYPISLNSVSKHVRMLERAGLVERTILGRDHILSLNANAMAEADEWMAYYRQFWTDRLAALDKMVQRKRRASQKKEKQK